MKRRRLGVITRLGSVSHSERKRQVFCRVLTDRNFLNQGWQRDALLDKRKIRRPSEDPATKSSGLGAEISYSRTVLPAHRNSLQMFLHNIGRTQTKKELQTPQDDGEVVQLSDTE